MERERGEFEAVWERVVSYKREAEEPVYSQRYAVKRLAEFIRAEKRICEYGKGLVRRLMRKGASEELAGIVREKGEYIRKMQLNYFLLTGDSLAIEVGGEEKGFILPMLRNLYLTEEAGIQEYKRAAAGEQNGRLKQLYGEIGTIKGAHLERLERMIEKLVC